MKKKLLLYRYVDGINDTPFPFDNIISDSSNKKDNPFVVVNPNPQTENFIKTNIYCDLNANEEYYISMRFDQPYSTDWNKGVEFYFLKDNEYKDYFGIVGYAVNHPDIELSKRIEDGRIEVIVKPKVSGRYYLRLDNNTPNSTAKFWDIIVRKNVYNEQIRLTSFTYNAQRMAATPTITASFNYPRCLDNDWGVDVFAEFNGERYYIRQIPSSSKDNKSVMYKHDLTLYSERFVLENIYLYDVSKNDDTNVIIRCDLSGFADLLNRSLEKSNLPYRVSIDDSVANTENALEIKDIALDKVYLSVALQEIYNQWEIPYYFDGYNIIVKDHSKWISDTILEYGYDKSLLSIKKDNANFRKITRCSGYGSDKNIPFFYPNLSQKGVIDLEPLENNKLLQKSDFVITDMRKFDKQMPLNGSVVYLTDDKNIPTISGDNGEFNYQNVKIGTKFNKSFSVKVEKGDIYVDVKSHINVIDSFWTGVYSYNKNNIININWKFPIKDTLPKMLMPQFKVVMSVVSSGGTKKIYDDIPVEELLGNISYTIDNGRYSYFINRAYIINASFFASKSDVFTSKEKIYDVNLMFYLEDSEDAKKHTSTASYTITDAISVERGGITAIPRSYSGQIYSIYGINASYSAVKDKGWYLNNVKKINLSDIGVKYLNAEEDSINGEGFKQVMVSKIPTAINLMPPLYRESLGNEKFYNAKDNTYLNDNNEYYDFETEWTKVNQNEHIQPFEEIYPTITNIVNADNVPFDEVLDVAFDGNDNNEVDEDGNFLHPYFYVKIAQFNGSNGFNLFDHKIVGDNMQVSFTSGDCSACMFDIMVKTRPNANNETYEDVINPIKTENGTLVSGDWKQKTAGDFGTEDITQQNSETNSIWLVLRKDDQTFGTTLPDSIGNVIPKKGDKFVLLNIEMPQQYIDSAEELLRKNIIQYMWENNSDKWNFTIDFSRIFLQENQVFVNDLSENAKVRVKYNGIIYDFYVNNFSYEVKSTEALPKIKIGLVDTLSINKGIAQSIANGVMQSVQGQLNGVAYINDLNEQYLRKRYDETMPNNMTFEKDINVNGNARVNGDIISDSFESNNYNGKDNFNVGFKLGNENGESVLVVDRAIIRKKIEAFELVINQLKAQGGTLLITPSSMKCVLVETYDTYYRCFLDTQTNNMYNQFEIDDLAICQSFGSSPKRYWRKVVGLGQDYIDLSIEDCEPNSDVPEIGDTIIQLGNATNIERQSAIEISSNGEKSPSFTMYSGINDYSLVNKEITGIEYSTIEYKEDSNGDIVKVADGYPNFFSYGSMYFGSRDKESNYISYQKNEQGEFEMVINAKTVFKSGTQNISDILASIDDNTKTANDNATQAQKTANQTKEKVENLNDAVKPITDAIKGSTEIKGGLVTTNVLMVKDTSDAIKGGISGDKDNIAFWSGGTYQDAIDGNCNIIIRKDGTAKIGSFVIEKDVAKIILADGNYATMSADGIEVTLANGGKATYNSSGVSIIDSNNDEKIKLINGDINFSKFRTTQDRLYSNIDIIDRNTPNSILGENVIITNSNLAIESNISNGKNSISLYLNASLFKFYVKYTDKPSEFYADYFNVQLVLLNKSNSIVHTIKKYAIKVKGLTANSTTNNYHNVLTNTEVTTDNFNTLNFGSNYTNSYATLSIGFDDVVENMPIGVYKLGFFVNRIAANGDSITSGVNSSSYKLEFVSPQIRIVSEEYNPKTLIGTNGFMNFQSSYKYFGAYLDNSNNYQIEAKGIINLNGKTY